MMGQKRPRQKGGGDRRRAGRGGFHGRRDVHREDVSRSRRLSRRRARWTRHDVTRGRRRGEPQRAPWCAAQGEQPGAQEGSWGTAPGTQQGSAPDAPWSGRGSARRASCAPPWSERMSQPGAPWGRGARLVGNSATAGGAARRRGERRRGWRGEDKRSVRREALPIWSGGRRGARRIRRREGRRCAP